MNISALIKLINMRLGKYLDNIQVSIQSKESAPQVFDYLIKLKYSDYTSIPVAIETKKNLRPVTLHLIESMFKNIQVPYRMIVADYISPPMAEELREMKIWFLDEEGNIYIEVPGKVFIFDTGHKGKSTSKRTSLITTTNAKLFFFLLRTGPRISSTYRQMATNAGVSLGKVSQFIGDLNDRQLIHVQKERITLRLPVKLLELWVESYLEKLKPRMYMGTFTWPKGSEFSFLEDASSGLNQKLGIGGERGGELLTSYLKPHSIDLWVDEINFQNVRQSLKLMDSVNGNIRVYSFFSKDMFYKIPGIKNKTLQVVHPLIVYADLMEIPDSRCQETARMIKEKQLEWIK